MTAPAQPRLEDKIAFLAAASSYPGYRGEVAVVETHLSLIFMTRERAYKLKKPVRRALIDFTGIDARYRNCLEELRLNRRLGGDTYIGIEPLCLLPGGRLHLGRGGVPVDWLVVMRRLPEQAMLDNQIRAGRLDGEALAQAAALLARFYQAEEPVAMTGEQYRQRLVDNVTQLFAELESFPLPADALRSLRQGQLTLLETHGELFAARARQGMILEAHGDLRPEHLCLSHPPVIIDCLEFSRDLRLQDRADELVFLAMECDKLGAPEVGETVFRVYGEITGDWPQAPLLDLYRRYRACIRARLCAGHLGDVPEVQAEHWLRRAREYLGLAVEYTRG
ncbi:hypothetical protein Q6D67_03500 [Haliea sp. E1-2-M8]|uniref:hypothetical protein n=1 Tax=Haliea sp. E1-2-M8 TaxID=3064706 RepID=UPI0027228F82|nr:hypothetical protein [Haliea sp. E1-2-M8]MDO8860757.1 hypothetical protein [Haliea sp. E1-2-M8]